MSKSTAGGAMSETANQRSREFLQIADQFKLGVLTTESSHPTTADLSEVAQGDIAAGLRRLFDVDDDVIRKYREWAASDRPRAMADTLRQALQQGGKVFFTGCGSTGRLSIQLVSSGAISAVATARLACNPAGGVGEPRFSRDGRR